MKRWVLLLALLGTGLAAGCGGDRKVNTAGRVVKGGKPYTIPADDFMRIQFVPFVEPGQNPRTCYIADYDNAAGTFKAIGPDLRGVPPGKYLVTVAHEKGKKDLFKGAYDMPRTPFVFDIEAGTEIELDLDKVAAK